MTMNIVLMISEAISKGAKVYFTAEGHEAISKIIASVTPETETMEKGA